jgi:hypothetical protein
LKNFNLNPELKEALKSGLLLVALALALLFLFFNLIFYSIALIIAIGAFTAYDFIKNKLNKRKNHE